MNYLVVGDLHQKLSNLEVAKKLFNYINQIVQNVKGEVKVIFLGDIYEVKSIIRVEVQNCFFEILCRLLGNKNCVAIDIVLGNHDYTNLNLVDHSFNFLRLVLDKNKKIRVIDKTTVDEADKIVYIPFMDDAKFVEEVGKLKLDKDYIIFCHQPFNGFYFNKQSGMIEKGGVDATKIPATIVAGHFHGHQHKGNVTYLGSPFAHTFAEADEEKKVLLIDENRDFNYFDTSSHVPAYHIVRITLDALLKSDVPKYNKEDHVKFLVEDTEENCKQVNRHFIKHLMEQGKLPECDNIYIQYSFINNRIDIHIDENQSVVKMYKDYVKLYYKDDIYKGLILKIGVERYLNNASV